MLPSWDLIFFLALALACTRLGHDEFLRVLLGPGVGGGLSNS